MDGTLAALPATPEVETVARNIVAGFLKQQWNGTRPSSVNAEILYGSESQPLPGADVYVTWGTPGTRFFRSRVVECRTPAVARIVAEQLRNTP